MNALLHDNLAGIRQIKTYVREAEQHERFNEASMNLQKSTLKVMRIWAIYNPSMSLPASLGMTPVVGFGAQAVLRQELSVGELIGDLLRGGFLSNPHGRPRNPPTRDQTKGKNAPRKRTTANRNHTRRNITDRSTCGKGKGTEGKPRP